jgi:hypothetical protein
VGFSGLGGEDGAKEEKRVVFATQTTFVFLFDHTAYWLSDCRFQSGSIQER